MKFPDVSGPLFAYLGHFRQPKFLRQGHNDIPGEELDAAIEPSDADNMNQFVEQNGEATAPGASNYFAPPSPAGNPL